MGACSSKSNKKQKKEEQQSQQQQAQQVFNPQPPQNQQLNQPSPLQLNFQNVAEPQINVENNKEQSTTIGVLQSINPGGQFDSKSLESMGNAMKFQNKIEQKNILEMNFESNNQANLKNVWKNEENL